MAIVMKNIFKYILAAAAVSFAATACVQEEAHTPGEPEVDGCYGVYFPAQETDIILDPSDPTTYTIKAVRNVSEGDINVPLTVVSETDVISVGDLAFADGQAESTITLDFSKSEVGVTYSCSIKIEDPQYASKYSVGSVAIDFQFCREKWNELGKVAVSEYYLWGIEIPSDHEAAAILYQNDLNKNLFRLENPFAKRYTNDFTDGDTWFTFRVLQPGDVLYKGQAGYETKITKSDLVYFDDFNTGFTHPNYGAKVLMCHPSGFNSFKGNQDAWAYSCVSQYQADGTPGVVEIGCLYYMDGVGGMNGSQELCMKIVFPGFVETDYSLEMEAGLTFDGAVPVAFYTGVDAAKIRFKAYEGRLNTAEKNKYIEALIAGTEEGTKEIDAVADDPETEEAEYAEAYLELAKTGVYTLVAATVDAEGNGQEGDVIEFTYVAPEDEEENAVVISCGVELTSAYEVLGKDKTNSAQVYITGKDVTELYYYMFPTSTVEENGLEACVAAMKSKIKPISEEELAEVNGSVYVKLVDKLTPKTAYTLVVYATNGYSEAVVTAEIETDGLPLIELGKASWKSEMWNVPENYLTDVVTDPNIKDEYRVYFDEQWFYCVIDKDKKTVNVPLQRMTAYNSSSSIYIIETRDFYKIMEKEGADELPVSSYSDQKDKLSLMVSYILISDADGEILGAFGDMSEVFSKPETAQSQSRLSISNIDFNNCELNNDFKTEKKFAIPVKVEERENCHTAVGAEFTIRKVTSATKSEIRNLENRFDSGINKLN